MKIKIVLIYFLYSFTQLFSLNISGPLYGKNLYLPHLFNYSFPGYSPTIDNDDSISLSLQYYLINEFVNYTTENIALDYESSVIESNLSYKINNNILIGVDFRYFFYYGGFLDTIIEEFHYLFHLPNANRELYKRDSVIVDIDNRYGTDTHLYSNSHYSGDTDLTFLYNFYKSDNINLSILAALKLPTGALKKLTGTNFFDTGFQFLGEFNISKTISFGNQQGFVLPMDILFVPDKSERYSTYIMYQSLYYLTLNIGNSTSIITQFRLNTSPIETFHYKNLYGIGYQRLFTLPQTTLLVGIKKQIGDFVFQAYIEEDPITFEGADVIFNLRVTKKMR